MYLNHRIFSLTRRACKLKRVRDRTCNIGGLHGHEVTAILVLSRREFRVDYDVIGDHVSPDCLGLGFNDALSPLTRANLDKAAIGLLNVVIQANHAAIRYHHRHLDMLNEAALAFKVGTVCDGELLIK